MKYDIADSVIKSIILQNGKHFERPFARKTFGCNSGRIAGILQRLWRIGKANQYQVFYRRKPKCTIFSEIPTKNRLGKGKSGKSVSVCFETKEEKRFVVNLIQKFPNHIIPTILYRFESR